MTVVGGREIHPVNLRVGGFYRVPTRRELAALRDELERGRETALALTRWAAGFTFPDFEQDYEFVAMSHAEDYPIERGRIASSAGLDIDVREYDEHFVEEHVEHSNALHSRLRERGAYCVGPMARFALNAERLSPLGSRGGRRGRAGRRRRAATPSAASWCAASSSSTRATRRCV